MKISPLTEAQAIKIIKATLYVSASAGISYLISLIANKPDLFGQLTPLVNILLVSIKQFFTQEK